MTEQAWCFPVSSLAEMSGMFSVMAEQYVSNFGLPQCYVKGGGENMGGERVQENDLVREPWWEGARYKPGVGRDHLLTH